MKKNFKRTLAAVMAAALTVTMIGMPSDAGAAKKKIKLSPSKVTVVKGKTKKVKIKNVKKKQVKKLKITLNKKGKKIASVTKSGKTALKVKGKKPGSAKATVSVTLKGKKKATKLKLTVKVKKAAAKKPSGGSTAGQTQAPGTVQTQAPGGTNPGGTTPTANPGTQATAEPTEPGATKPARTRPPVTPNPWPDYQKPDKKGKDMVLKYTDELKSTAAPHGGKLDAAGKIAFRDAKEGWTGDDKFDIMEYDRVIIKIHAAGEAGNNKSGRATMGAGDDGEQWSGKVGLSSTTNENLGATQDGFCTQYDGEDENHNKKKGRLVFLNDIDGTTEEMGGTSPRENSFKTEAYPDGYLVEYKIPDDIAKNDWWSPADVSKYCDCINFQLAIKSEGAYDNFYVEEIQLLSDKTVTKENLEIASEKDAVKVDEATKMTVSLKDAPEGAEIKSVTWSADPADNAAVSDEAVADDKQSASAKVTGKKKADKVTVTADVTATIGDKEFKGLKVSKEIKVEEGQQGGDEIKVEAKDLEVKATAAEVEAGKTTKLTVSLKSSAPEGAEIKSVVWSAAPADVAKLSGDKVAADKKSGETTFEGLKAGETTVTAKVTVTAGGKEFKDLAATAKVTVKAKAAETTQITADDLDLTLSLTEIEAEGSTGATVSLKEKVADTVKITGVVWSAVDSTVASCTKNVAAADQRSGSTGITGLKAGTTKIKAVVTAQDGGKEPKEVTVVSAADLTVLEKIEVTKEDIDIVVTPANKQIRKNETATVEVSLNGDVSEEAQITAVEWAVSDTSAVETAAVDGITKQAYVGKKEADVTVTAKVTVTARGEDFPVFVKTADFSVVSLIVDAAYVETAGAEEVVAGEDVSLAVKVETQKTELGYSDHPEVHVTWRLASTESATIESGATQESVKVKTKKAGTIKVFADVVVTDNGDTGRISLPYEFEVQPVLVPDVAIKAEKTEIAQNEVLALELENKGAGDITAVTWRLAPTESATIEEKTGKLTGTKAGEVTVKANVTVKSGKQEKTVEVPKTITVNRNRFLSLMKSNYDSTGPCYPNATSNAHWEFKEADRNEDGSITVYTSGMWGGGGLEFYLNEDKTNLDLSQWSKVRVTLSVAEEEARGLNIGLVCDGKVSVTWSQSPVNATAGDLYPTAKGSNQTESYEIALNNAIIPQNTDKGEECGTFKIRVKQNGGDENTRTAITIYSIELIAK